TEHPTKSHADRSIIFSIATELKSTGVLDLIDASAIAAGLIGAPKAAKDVFLAAIGDNSRADVQRALRKAAAAEHSRGGGRKIRSWSPLRTAALLPFDEKRI